MRFIADEFGVKTERSYQDTLKNFEQYLLDQYRSGVSPILLVDEAQNLPHDTLKTIHHLFNFTTKDEFLIQMALLGQPELGIRIKRFQSLASRMYATTLQPFSREQTKEMMQFRWTVSGGKKLPFDEDAITEVYRLTGGIAREICKLANETLLRALITKRRMIDKDTVVSAATDAFHQT